MHCLTEEMRSTPIFYNKKETYPQLEKLCKPLVPPHSLGGDYTINSNDDPQSAENRPEKQPSKQHKKAERYPTGEGTQ